MTEQDTSIENEVYEFWHRVIWNNLKDWNEDLKLNLQHNVGTYNTQTCRWSGLKIMNFIDTQNASSYGKKYLPGLNDWVCSRDLLNSITIPRKVE